MNERKLEAVLFGSIGTLVETSEMQRDAFNRAFAEHGLDWHWDRDAYRGMLSINGGRKRLSHYARETGADLDEEGIEALHATKTRLFDEAMERDGVPLRPGVRSLLDETREAGLLLGFVTGTVRDNAEAMANAAGLDLSTFDLVTDKSSVSAEKPDPAIYTHALERLGVEPHAAVAIEDTQSSLAAAVAAGCVSVATPGANALDQSFDAADLTVASLEEVSLERLRALVGSAKPAQAAA